MATYRLTVEYRHARSGYGEIDWRSTVRWRWILSETVTNARWKGDVTKNDILSGRSRWRWRAVWQSKKALKKVTSGIDLITEHGDLDARISKLEKELKLSESLIL
jgi:hypothetical protein